MEAANVHAVKIFKNLNCEVLNSVLEDGYISNSEVIAFLMKEPSAVNMYKSIETSKNTTITLTGNHLIYTKNGNADPFHPM